MAEGPPPEDPATDVGSETPDTQKPPEELRSEIAEARQELGETVEQLAAKADVKARAQEAADEAKGRAQEQVEERKEQVRQVADRVQAAAQQKRAEGLRTDDVVGAARAGAQKAQEKPTMAIAAGVGAALIVLLVVRGRRR